MNVWNHEFKVLMEEKEDDANGDIVVYVVVVVGIRSTSHLIRGGQSYLR